MITHPRKHYALDLKGRQLQVGNRTLVMGIINVTPDSFADGGQYLDFQSAVEHASELIAAGADLLDLGGESTRPFSDPVPVDVELDRVIPVIKAIRRQSEIPVSIDTTKAEVAREAILAGADIINDISALRFDDEMANVAAALNTPVVLMHMLGIPRTMQEQPTYSSLFSEIISFLEERIRFATERGIKREQILVDPGIGFGKTIEHNLLIVKNLDLFGCLDRPILFGASRKRFIGSILDRPPREREVGTAVVNALAISAGAHIVRVHDVALHRQVALMGDALREVA
jgi:dihydropteroate synthase